MVSIGEQSQVAVIGEEEAAIVSFCRVVSHSETLILHRLSTLTLRPEEIFAIPLSLTLGRLCALS